MITQNQEVLMFRKRHFVYMLLAASMSINVYLLLADHRPGMLYGAPDNQDVLRQLNEKTYAEDSSTEPLVGSPVQYFIFKDARRNKILYVFKYKDQITSEIADAD